MDDDSSSSGVLFPPRGGFLPATQLSGAVASDLSTESKQTPRQGTCTCQLFCAHHIYRLVVVLASPFIYNLPPPPLIKSRVDCRAEALACRPQVEHRRLEGTNGLAACVVKGTHALAATAVLAAAHFARQQGARDAYFLLRAGDHESAV